MPTARRMNRGISDEDRAALKREVLAEVRDAMYAGETIDDVRDALDERDPDPLNYEDIAAMSEADINSDWARVQRVLEAGPGRGQFAGEPSDEQPPAQRRPTGQQAIGHPPDFTPLTLDVIRRMSVEEITARKGEVDAVLARGGRA